MSLIIDSLKSQDAPEAVRQAALDRTHLTPGIPTSEGTTASFWLREPFASVPKIQLKDRSDNVDIAIIGSGITGLSVAWTILQTCKDQGIAPPSVRLFEARDACSGATGRNGGHLLETALHYRELKRFVGREDAMKITKFRLTHLKEIETILAERPEIRKQSQFRKVEFVSVYFDATTYQDGLDNLDEFKKDMPEEARGHASHTGSALQDKFQLSEHVHGVITGPGGAVWPYRLVSLLFEELQREFPASFEIEVNTPISEIRVSETSAATEQADRYTVVTCRGDIQARQVIHCTNGYVGHLVPGFRGRIFPLRGQMSAQDPGALFPAQGRRRSWVFNYLKGFDYLTQLPSLEDDTDSKSEMMLGGGLAATIGHGVEEIGISSDDTINLYADIHLSGALPAVFDRKKWGSSDGVKNMWTGIMGFSSDSFPWVGQLPVSMTGRTIDGESSGAEWTAAGFSGEGMVHAWLSGKAVALMVLVQEDVLPRAALVELHGWLPEQMQITEERVQRAVLPKTLCEL